MNLYRSRTCMGIFYICMGHKSGFISMHQTLMITPPTIYHCYFITMSSSFCLEGFCSLMQITNYTCYHPVSIIPFTMDTNVSFNCTGIGLSIFNDVMSSTDSSAYKYCRLYEIKCNVLNSMSYQMIKEFMHF